MRGKKEHTRWLKAAGGGVAGGKAVPGLSHYRLVGPIEAYPQRPDVYKIPAVHQLPQCPPTLPGAACT